MDPTKDISSWTEHLDQKNHDILVKAHSWNLTEQLQGMGMYPYFQPLDENQGPVARYQGKEVVMLGSNNYLGLTTHPKVREASIEAIRKYGTGMTGSRFLNGSLKIHEELEEKLADFLGMEACLVFTTGYQANLGMLTGIVNKDSVALVDRFAHASIHDGCRLMEGENIRFEHNNVQDLEKKLQELPHDTGPLICVDGVYSMEGDLAPLQEMVALAKKHEVRLAVDDAHGIGVMGPGGRGTAHHFGVEKDIDIMVGTFSKSLASTGGYVAGDKKVVNFIKHFGRPMIFSASLTPSCTAAARQALDILIDEPERAETVRKNAQFMKRELDKMGFETGACDAAIVPVILRDTIKTFMIWKQLLDEGVYTNPVPYPAVAKGNEMLRTSYLATHTEEHLVRALEIFKKVGSQYGIVKG